MVDAYYRVDNVKTHYQFTSVIKKASDLIEQREYDQLEELGRRYLSDKIQKPFEEQHQNCWCYILIASAYLHKGLYEEARRTLNTILKTSRRWFYSGWSTEQTRIDDDYFNETIHEAGFRFSLETIHQLVGLFCRHGNYEKAEETYRSGFSMLEAAHSTLYGKKEMIRLFQAFRDLRSKMGGTEDVIRCCKIITRTGCEIAVSRFEDSVELCAEIVRVCMDTAVYLEERGLLEASEDYLMQTVNWIEKIIRSEGNRMKKEQQKLLNMGYSFDPEKLDLLNDNIEQIRTSILEMQKISIYPMMSYANRLLKKGEKKQADRYYHTVRECMKRAVFYSCENF